MELLHPRCPGLDVHKDTVVACVRLAECGVTDTPICDPPKNCSHRHDGLFER